jgi:hypothetical protein
MRATKTSNRKNPRDSARQFSAISAIRFLQGQEKAINAEIAEKIRAEFAGKSSSFRFRSLPHQPLGGCVHAHQQCAVGYG